MPSPTSTVAEFQRIPLDQITPSKTNTRTDYAGPEFDELVADIKARGVLMPVLVRPLRQITFELKDGNEIDVPPAPFRAGMVTDALQECGISEDDVKGTAINDSAYELIAGERRYRASLAAGLTEISARVVALTDAQAVEAQLVENLQRKDLKPLEEARGYIELLDVMAKEQPEAKREELVKQLAARVNKAPRTVYAMMQLTKLIPDARKAIEEGRLSTSHGDLLVRLQPKDQEKILKQCFEDKWDHGHVEKGVAISVRAMKDRIQQGFYIDLKAAIWDLADETLVAAAGACSSCDKVVHEDDQGVNHPVCSDRTCFNTKQQAFVQLRIDKESASADEQVVKLSWKYSSSKPKVAKDGDANHVHGWAPNQIFKRGQWIEAKKRSECPAVITGITVDEDTSWERRGKAGTRKLVCIAEKCAVHKKEWECANAQRGHSGYDEKAEKEREEKAKEARTREHEIRLAMAKAALSKVAKLDDVILRLVAIDLASGWNLERADKALGSSVSSALKEAPINSERFARALAATLLTEDLGPYDPQDGRKEFHELIRKLGANPESIRAGFEKTQKPEKSKLQTSAKKATTAKEQVVPKLKALTPLQLASLKPEPKAKAAKKATGKKSAAKKSAKKGGRK